MDRPLLKLIFNPYHINQNIWSYEYQNMFRFLLDILLEKLLTAVADPGFGQGGAQLVGGPNFETGRIYAWFYIELCQTAQNVCSNFGAGGPGPLGPPGSATEQNIEPYRLEILSALNKSTTTQNVMETFWSSSFLLIIPIRTKWYPSQPRYDITITTGTR